MLVFKSIENIPKEKRGYSVAIGNFDGMHLGHQSVIEIAREKSNNSFVGVHLNLTPDNIFKKISQYLG